MKWLFISSTAIWVTGSDTGSVASRARTELTSSKCDWTWIWTIYNVDETTHSKIQFKNLNSISDVDIWKGIGLKSPTVYSSIPILYLSAIVMSSASCNAYCSKWDCAVSLKKVQIVNTDNIKNRNAYFWLTNFSLLFAADFQANQSKNMQH